jgi:hypothetical protein
MTITQSHDEGLIIARVEAKIRDGCFQYFEYEPDGSDVNTYLSDQYPKEVKEHLRIHRPYFDGKPCAGLTPLGFAQLFFPDYHPPVDPDHEAWWEGWKIEL